MSDAFYLSCEGRLSSHYHIATPDAVGLCGRAGLVSVSCVQDVEAIVSLLSKQRDQCAFCRQRIEAKRDVVTRLAALA